MALPRTLKDFNLFGDGDNWVSQVSEIVLPKLARVVEDYVAGGMVGAVEIDLGMEKMEMEWTADGLIDAIFDGFGKSSLDGNMLRFTGSYERDDTGETVAAEVVVRGRHREIDMGTAKRGEKNQIKVMTSLSYYKLTIGGQEVLEVDMIGYVFKVNGEDRLAERRANLGV